MNLAFYNDRNPVTGRSVLWWVISFFAVIFIANFFFIYFALSSWTGLSTENAYEKGVRFNETLAKADAQKIQGWQSTVSLVGGTQLKIILTDKNQRALRGLGVSAKLIRPVKEGNDQKFMLKEFGPGIYQAPVAFSHQGRWQVEVIVGDQYRMRHDLEVK
jgi:nitrogen fixation protein FixH